MLSRSRKNISYYVASTHSPDRTSTTCGAHPYLHTWRTHYALPHDLGVYFDVYKFLQRKFTTVWIWILRQNQRLLSAQPGIEPCTSLWADARDDNWITSHSWFQAVNFDVYKFLQRKCTTFWIVRQNQFSFSNPPRIEPRTITWAYVVMTIEPPLIRGPI